MEALTIGFSSVSLKSPILTIIHTKLTDNSITVPSSLSKTLENSSISTLNTPSPVSSSKSISSSRRSAIDGVKSSVDLESALSRAEGLLQVEDYNIILRFFGESKRWRELSQLFDWMQRKDEVNRASYSSYFKYTGLSRNIAKVLEVYNNIKEEEIKLNVSVCNSVLGSLARNGRPEVSLKLFDQMKSSGLFPDLVTYSTLLTGCSKLNDGYQKALDLLKEMKENKLEMDSVIYGTILAICAKNNLREEADFYFEKMKEEGLRPNLFHYSSLLNVYAEDRNYIKADILINDMKSLGIAPNKVILTTLLKAYARGGLFEKSKELLAQLESLGYAQDEIPYCILMDNLAKQGDIKQAQNLFAQMKEKGVRSDGYAYSIMISSLCRIGLRNEAKQIAREFESEYAKYDNVVILNTLLRAYCNGGEMESVMLVLKKMDESGVLPDWNTFHILIKYFCKEKLYHLSYKTIEDMHSKGLQLNEELCSSVMIQLGKTGFPSEALSVYQMLRYSKRNLSKSIHERVLNILVTAGLLKDAYLVMKDYTEVISDRSLQKFAFSFMKSGNINLINDVLKAYHRSKKRISQEIFGKAIERYVQKPEKKELLLHLLQWMEGQGYTVGPASRNLLLKNAHLFGHKQIIAEILSKQQLMSRKFKKRPELRR